MFSRILVPLDGTAESNAALPLARTLARATGASITLLRVLPTPDLPADRAVMATASHGLERIVDELRVESFTVEAVVRDGDVVDEILAQSRAESADLIIMRTHGRAGLGRAILGSVAERVLAESGVPVLLMRPGGRRISHLRTLVVPIDGSPGGAVALGTAVGLARMTGAALKLVEVAVPIPLYVYAGYEYGGIAEFDPGWDEESLNSARDYVTRIVSRLRGAGLTVDGEALMAPNVAETITQVADTVSADLIVMSTQALTGAARVLLGSVADAVVRSAKCPVLLIHRADIDAQTEPQPTQAAPEAVTAGTA